MKSSPEARKLIKKAMRLTRNGDSKNVRKAAQLLGLKNHARMLGMLNGRLRDTPDMKVLIAAQKRKSNRAFLSLQPGRAQNRKSIDCDRLRYIAEQQQKLNDLLIQMLKECEEVTR